MPPAGVEIFLDIKIFSAMQHLDHPASQNPLVSQGSFWPIGWWHAEMEGSFSRASLAC